MNAAITSTLAEKISNLAVDDLESEKSILNLIESLSIRSPELVNTHLGISALVWAFLKASPEIAIAIIKKQYLEDFLGNFKCEEENQKNVGEILLRVLDLELDLVDVIDKRIKDVIKDLHDRKMLALLAGKDGESNFYGIPWQLGGHHNYVYIFKSLFKELNENLDKIIPVVFPVNNFVKNESEKILVEAIRESIQIMNNLNSSSKLGGKILPVLVATGLQKNAIVNNEMLRYHAEGFVWYDPQFLLIERSNPHNSGVDIYKVKKKLNGKKFEDFLQKAQKSTQGQGRALDTEEYFGYIAENFEKTEHIDMALQALQNCPVASSEGIYLATLYCQLLKKGIEQKTAKLYVTQYVQQIFSRHTQLMIEKIRERIAITTDKNLADFLQQILTNNALPSKQVNIAPSAAGGGAGPILVSTGLSAAGAGAGAAAAAATPSTVHIGQSMGSQSQDKYNTLFLFDKDLGTVEQEDIIKDISEGQVDVKRLAEVNRNVANSASHAPQVTVHNTQHITVDVRPDAPLLLKNVVIPAYGPIQDKPAHKVKSSNCCTKFCTWLWSCCSKPKIIVSKKLNSEDNKKPPGPSDNLN